MRGFGLIGRSLSHSFSPAYFQEKFDREKIEDARYSLFPLENIEDFPALIHANPDIQGLNVTIPYKEEIIPYLDELDDTAREIGAVNCIKVTGGKSKGYNTDAFGFSHSMKPFLESHHSRALILGTGGASKAVAFTLKKLGIAFFYVSRKAGEGILTYDQLNDMVLRHHPLIINTTPLGTYPDIDESPLSSMEGVGQNHFVIDLVYNPEKTRLLKEAELKGAMILNGYDMLKHQAEKSWQIWNEQ